MKEFKRTLRELLDNYPYVSFKTVSEYCTKKYVGGKRNIGIPKKLKTKMSFGHGPGWGYGKFDSNLHDKVIVYFDDTNSLGLVDGWLVHCNIFHDTFCVTGVCLVKNTKRTRECIINLNLNDIRAFGFPLTDEAFFAIQTVVDLQGITKNELHYIMKIANSLKK